MSDINKFTEYLPGVDLCFIVINPYLFTYGMIIDEFGEQFTFVHEVKEPDQVSVVHRLTG